MYMIFFPNSRELWSVTIFTILSGGRRENLISNTVFSVVEFVWFLLMKLCLCWNFPSFPRILNILNIYIVTWKSECVSGSVMSKSLWPHGLQPTRILCPWNSPGKNTGVGCHSLLQGIFPSQESNPVSCIAGGFFTTEYSLGGLKPWQPLHNQKWCFRQLCLIWLTAAESADGGSPALR